VQEVIDAEDQTKLDFLINRFKAFDTDGNGKIDREELRLLLESVDNATTVLCQHWLPEEELDRTIQTYDKDGNGTIDFEEFKNIVYDGLLLDGMLSEYEDAFNAVDKSGNGTIGANELAQLLANLGQPISMEKLVEVMQQYDVDQSGQIEFNEFLLMFRNQLLDLKEVQSYVAGNLTAPAKPGGIIDTVEGDITLIFSEQELDEVLERHKEQLVVLFSGLTWCRPCKAMQRPIQKLAAHYSGPAVFLKLFGNSNDKTKALFKERLKIRSTPCFMVFKNKEAAYVQTGANKEKLEAGIRELIPEAQRPVGIIYPSQV